MTYLILCSNIIYKMGGEEMQTKLYGVDYRNKDGKLCNELATAKTEAEAIYKAAVQLEKRGCPTDNSLERVYIEGILR